MQQFNTFYLLKDLRKLSCNQNDVNHFQRFLPVIVISLFILIFYFHSNYLLFILITIIVFSYFKRNLAACIFNYFTLFHIYNFFGPRFPRISWNLVIVFVSRYLYAV